MSDPSLAAIANAVLCDFGIITKDDTKHVIDVNKIRREKARIGEKNIQERLKDLQAMEVIGTDGKKDKGSLTVEERLVNGQKIVSRRKESVDHHTFTIESGI